MRCATCCSFSFACFNFTSSVLYIVDKYQDNYGVLQSIVIRQIDRVDGYVFFHALILGYHVDHVYLLTETQFPLNSLLSQIYR